MRSQSHGRTHLARSIVSLIRACILAIGGLAARVAGLPRRRRIKFTYDPSRTTWQAIHDLLRETKPTGKNGPLAQHLVGAKLSLRFPDDDVRNDSHSTADDQLGRAGDYQVGGTVFHVTVAPMPAVCEKCKVNLDRGLRACLIAPDDRPSANSSGGTTSGSTPWRRTSPS